MELKLCRRRSELQHMQSDGVQPSFVEVHGHLAGFQR
jgi:hypothetical protein